MATLGPTFLSSVCRADGEGRAERILSICWGLAWSSWEGPQEGVFLLTGQERFKTVSTLCEDGKRFQPLSQTYH